MYRSMTMDHRGGAGRTKKSISHIAKADDGELEVDSPFMEAGMDSIALNGRELNRFVDAA